MKNGYYGGIDIGTNAARMVIKNVYMNDKREIVSYIVQELRVPLRLGVDVFKDGRINLKKEEQLIKTMACFKALMEIYDVVAYRALATSAMREAANGKDLIWRIRKETGVDVKIISGETEAFTITKIAQDMGISDGKWAFVDVGGGSTEVTLMVKGKVIDSHSYELGTLRILAGKAKPETWRKFKRALSSYETKYGPLNIVGTGGNINRYWKMSSHEEKKGTHALYVKELDEEYNALKKLSVPERMDQYKLKPDRADVIIPAGDIFLTAATLLKSTYVLVPMTGLGDGIVDSLIAEQADTMNVI